ncbi:MAG: hypothetical protein IT345_11790 [Trueperaceae bacterium]|nr:hypothetical protein [Trueperaceae bacterium]
MKTTATNTEELMRSLLGRVAFAAPVGAPRGCCLRALEATRSRRAAGARHECPECGQVLKGVWLGAGRAGRDDVLARGAGAAIAKEAAVGYRVAAVFVSKGAASPGEIDAALSRAGLAPGAPAASEFGWWAGTAPDGALAVEAEPGVWLVLQEIDGA